MGPYIFPNSTFLHISVEYLLLFLFFLFLADVSGESRSADIDKVYIARKPQNGDPVLKSRENFVGYMQQMVFNGNHFFEMARTGNLRNIETNANFDKKDKLVQFPITFKSTGAYVTTRLNLYSTFTIFFQLKTTQPNGLIMYNGDGTGDFFALELVNGHIQYVYNVGSGPRFVPSMLDQKINDNKWHEIGVLRTSLEQFILRVDETAAFDNLPDNRAVHLDTNDKLYIGGVPLQMYAGMPKHIKSREGFQGCLASLDLDGDSRNILEQRAEIQEEHRHLIVEGCEGNELEHLVLKAILSHLDRLSAYLWVDYKSML